MYWVRNATNGQETEKHNFQYLSCKDNSALSQFRNIIAQVILSMFVLYTIED